MRVRHIRGIVRNRATGEPVANAVLRLVPRVPSPHALIANTTSDKAGMFDLQGRAVRLNEGRNETLDIPIIPPRL